MKITKGQLRRIIREEKRRILNEIGPSRPIPNPEMKSPGEDTPGEKGMKNQAAAKKLQTALAKLQDLTYNVDESAAQEINNQLILIEDAMELMGMSY